MTAVTLIEWTKFKLNKIIARNALKRRCISIVQFLMKRRTEYYVWSYLRHLNAASVQCNNCFISCNELFVLVTELYTSALLLSVERAEL